MPAALGPGPECSSSATASAEVNNVPGRPALASAEARMGHPGELLRRRPEDRAAPAPRSSDPAALRMLMVLQRVPRACLRAEANLDSRWRASDRLVRRRGRSALYIVSARLGPGLMSRSVRPGPRAGRETSAAGSSRAARPGGRRGATTRRWRSMAATGPPAAAGRLRGRASDLARLFQRSALGLPAPATVDPHDGRASPAGGAGTPARSSDYGRWTSLSRPAQSGA